MRFSRGLATILSGTKLAQDIRTKTAQEVVEMRAEKPFFRPSLSIVQVGERPDSLVYVRMKLKAARAANVHATHIKLPATILQEELLQILEQMNADSSVHGILVQLPLPQHLDESVVTNAVASEKDVDGFTSLNAGDLAKRAGEPKFLPCTPHGVMKLIEASGVEIAGKTAVVLGRLDIVGVPVAQLLQKQNATVTVCHSRTPDIESFVRRADIVVAAVGRPGFVKGLWIKPGALVIDVGINYVPDSSKKSGQRLVGDVDFELAKDVAGVLTPVPGGVGPMTVAMLVQNVVESAKRAQKHAMPPLVPQVPVPLDIEVLRFHKPREIAQVAADLGVLPKEFQPYGEAKGKVLLNALQRLKGPDGRYILVAGITPTPLGEGKSTTTIGLVQALGAHLGKRAVANVRQPLMGPTFGVKGGAAGGGYAQVVPMDEFNMHLTGDIHAIGAANNLVAAAVDARVFHEQTQKNDATFYKRLVPSKGGKRAFTPLMLLRLRKLGINKTNPDDLTPEEIRTFARLDIDPDTISVRRVVDVNDRFLREVTIGQAPTEKGYNRKSGFDITVASELMAILALSSSLSDLRARVGRMVVALDRSGRPVTCEDICVAGAVTALLKDAINPNLMQTLEGQPVMVHAGPFANILIGALSVVADKLGLKLMGPKEGTEAGYVVTEAGFDFTMGGERFFNIKCRSSGLVPNVVVLVATTRALKLHGGGPDVKPGQSLPQEYVSENLDLVRAGCENLKKQIENARLFGCPVVVAVNRFSSDSDSEILLIQELAKAAGADAAVSSNHWAEGGKGAVDLAKAVVEASEARETQAINFTYDVEEPIVAKLEAIVKKMYGGDGIELSEVAKKQVEWFEKNGFDKLPICVAKTQYSLSHDASLKGVPKGFKIPIREIKASVGAGYLYALAGKIMTIPGLPTHSGFMGVEVENGEIEGLF